MGLIDKKKLLMELSKLKSQVMYESFNYQGVQLAMLLVEQFPEVDEDDVK